MERPTTYHTLDIVEIKYKLYLVHVYNLVGFKLSLIADLLMQLQNMPSRLSVIHYELN
jgi:hypothetical protein